MLTSHGLLRCHRLREPHSRHWGNESGRNARTVWTIPTQPLPDEHYAAFPEALAERCIKAGTSERGCCPECGAAWVREVEKGSLVGSDRGGNRRGQDVGTFVKNNPGTPGMAYENITVGWASSCNHGLDPVPCTVLDPFMGSGTSALVARRLGRHAIGIELSEKYCEIARRRTQQQSLLA